MKEIYIIPWFFHSKNTPWYLKLQSSLEEKWYNVKILNITWRFRTISHWVSQVDAQIHNKGSIILWFSFGAMVALKLSEKYKFSKVILCSLSPYFSEDVKKFSLIRKIKLWLFRWYDFYKNYSEKIIKNPLQNELTFIYGWDESINLQSRNQIMIKSLWIIDVHCIEWVRHEIHNSMYQKTILSLFD